MVETSHIPRTIMEVFQQLPEGTLAEVIHNTLYMSPAPTPSHQRLFLNLASGMHAFVSAQASGEIFIAPIDVYLDEASSVVQPDILFVPFHSKIKIDSGGLHGTPDLIVEILSPGNKKRDLVIKKELYEKIGVKEYWIVDPDTKEVVGYKHQHGRYVSLQASSGEIKFELLYHTFTF